MQSRSIGFVAALFFALLGAQPAGAAGPAPGPISSFGLNLYGQLGDGTNVNRTSPVQASGVTDALAVAAIAGGAFRSVALRSDHTVVTWGSDDSGQLGNGSAAASNTPTPVSGLSNVSAIAGGSYHSLALRSDGTVAAWGDNAYGELGNG